MDVKAGGPEFDHAPTVTHEFPPSPPPQSHKLEGHGQFYNNSSTTNLSDHSFFFRKPI